VQGVFYRASTREKARELGVTGFVKNQRNGSVYMEAEGTTEQLDALVDWCRQGPPQSVVEKVHVENGDVIGFDQFRIKH